VIPYAKIVGILGCLTKKYPLTSPFNSSITSLGTLISKAYIVLVSNVGLKDTTPYAFS
jgi:hypothetical protein